jgi:low affinity Fe/Cu permease
MGSPMNGARRFFDRLSGRLTHFTGTTPAFMTALGIVLVWAVTGPLFHYSDTWQLVINTGTTVVTFLMVFLIQHTQNKDSLAVQLKLNELIAATRGASNRLVNIEQLDDEELSTLHQFYAKLAAMSKEHQDLLASHSIDEAQARHRHKHPPKAPAQ